MVITMIELLFIIPILFFSVIIHECAHGLVALFFGDDTAKREGRLTLNIIRHVDLMGTIILPAILLVFYLITGTGIFFGWAKPVPVNIYKLKNPNRDYVFVSLAGPLSNIFLALIFALIMPVSMVFFQGYDALHSLVYIIGYFGVNINLILAMFNLIPIPPLDGSHVLSYLLPPSLSQKFKELGRYGFAIIMILIFTDALKYPFWLADYISKALISMTINIGL